MVEMYVVADGDIFLALFKKRDDAKYYAMQSPKELCVFLISMDINNIQIQKSVPL